MCLLHQKNNRFTLAITDPYVYTFAKCTKELNVQQMHFYMKNIEVELSLQQEESML